MKSLYESIHLCKDGNKDILLEIINKFNPLLNKYSRLLNYEDAKSDFTLFFIELVYKFPINNEAFIQDAYIVSYINKAIKNKYIHLSKKKMNIEKCEVELNLDIANNFSYNNSLDDKLYINDLFKCITKKEKEILVLKYIKGYSDVEISKIYKISRQAVNRMKIRAFNKIVCLYGNSESYFTDQFKKLN
ncbi:sigma-70 family RNA polymerase sigma factor [Desnuesiella massiliensis]|uniref:sigma-70 family RNA polymerase sigma factor n=1 Tax=Desnuesiella massiliensis TaxID=1650662 RepID=UPI0006E41C7D|nr:sigma-70 family RNA polymerase sigma factor [Desnuesiella massiliensis]